MRIRTPAELGRLIRSQRKRQGLRQVDLAAMVGTSHVSLRDIERGKAGAQLGRVLQLLDELGIRLSADTPDGETDERGQAP